MIFFEGKEYDLTMGKYSTELFTAENLENLERAFHRRKFRKSGKAKVCFINLYLILFLIRFEWNASKRK